MKHNLKTFPESPFDDVPERVVVLMQEWKRNFEKELRERHAFWNRPPSKNEKILGMENREALLKLFEEILGESP